MSATLVSLRIKNLALVEEMLWEPPGGFVAVTGETGAGKSVILGAVKLLLGERADKSVVRSGSEQCIVEGVFQLPCGSPAHAVLENAGAEPCEDGALIVKRTVPASGSGRQFVNGSACTLGLLQELGDMLVDLHGPHDHQSLFSKDRQLALLDHFAGATELRATHSKLRTAWQSLVAERDRISANSEAIAREIELLGHQTAEIDGAALRDGEEEELVERQRAAANSQRICELCTQLSTLLGDSEDSIPSKWQGSPANSSASTPARNPSAPPCSRYRTPSATSRPKSTATLCRSMPTHEALPRWTNGSIRSKHSKGNTEPRWRQSWISARRQRNGSPC
jgi:DNA repair protein RecN (Recombination protein N)